MRPIYWIGDVPKHCELIAEHPITTEFIDGRLTTGGWALMCPECHKVYGGGLLGVGYGQRFRKQSKGWLKVEG